MPKTQQLINTHYGVSGILDSIQDALTAMGKNMDHLIPADLVLVDAFHLRGRESTLELADRTGIQPGLIVLDVGCGLGGSVRYLASERECNVTGIDLTEEYVNVATALSKLVGLENKVQFHHASALELPFENETFDLIWTEHVQMNIEDKRLFYGEIFRVLKPGGRLLFHDIFLGGGGELHYPVPWASEPSFSFLWPLNKVQNTLEAIGFSIADWEDKTRPSEEFLKKMKEAGPQPLGIHLLMGDTAPIKIQNVLRNLQENRICVIQAVAEKARNG
ncbi:MAG: methyltransferase domain-containing protein [Nitrospinota bacterium]|nr:methyltransferase domain-containing protein [Nitrospinota bacterium]